MGVSYDWYDDSQTVMVYTAEGDWNWNDYHKAVRMSLFSLHGLEHPVDMLLDLRGTDKTPAGAVAHLRSVGKRLHDNLSGRAVIVGLDDATARQLVGAGARMLQFGEQTLYFADTPDEAIALLRS